MICHKLWQLNVDLVHLMWIEMKGILITVFLLIVTISAEINFIKLFSGNETPLPWPVNTVIEIGNVTKINQNLTESDLKASKKAIDLAEVLRETFDVGIFPLPPLDPYRSNSQKRIILSPQEFINGSITLNSITITGAKLFVLEGLQIRLNTGRIDYKVFIKELRVLLDNVETDLVVNGRPMNMKLNMSIILVDLNLSGAFQTKKEVLGDSENNRIFQVIGGILAINTSEVRVAIDQMIDLFTSLRYLKQMSSLPPRWWVTIQRDLERHVLKTLIEQVNDILKNLSVEQVEGYLLSAITAREAGNENN